MHRYRVSVMDHYGKADDESGELSSWGPYVSTITSDKTLQELTPYDFFDFNPHIPADSVVDQEDGDEDYLTFDITIYDIDDAGTYRTLNYLVTRD